MIVLIEPTFLQFTLKTFPSPNEGQFLTHGFSFTESEEAHFLVNRHTEKGGSLKEY